MRGGGLHPRNGRDHRRPEVYSYFLQIGYDDFYLSRAENVYLPGGKPLFAQGRLGQKPEEALASAGLKPGPTQRLEDGVSLVDWKPAGKKEVDGKEHRHAESRSTTLV